jgi:hypothetical protein
MPPRKRKASRKKKVKAISIGTPDSPKKRGSGKKKGSRKNKSSSKGKKSPKSPKAKKGSRKGKVTRSSRTASPRCRKNGKFVSCATGTGAIAAVAAIPGVATAHGFIPDAPDAPDAPLMAYGPERAATSFGRKINGCWDFRTEKPCRDSALGKSMNCTWRYSDKTCTQKTPDAPSMPTSVARAPWKAPRLSCDKLGKQNCGSRSDCFYDPAFHRCKTREAGTLIDGLAVPAAPALQRRFAAPRKPGKAFNVRSRGSGFPCRSYNGNQEDCDAQGDRCEWFPRTKVCSPANTMKYGSQELRSTAPDYTDWSSFVTY